jgi:hypothetical protein
MTNPKPEGYIFVSTLPDEKPKFTMTSGKPVKKETK